MRQQYRMQEPLAGIAERFANGQQTMEDALVIPGRTVAAHRESLEWGEEFTSSAQLSRVICSENNSKAALNMGIAEWAHPEEWYMWDAIDEVGVGKKSKAEPNAGLLVEDQLEPVQFVWQYMAVTCLENVLGTMVVNGQLCWVVHIVFDDEGNDEYGFTCEAMVEDEAADGGHEEEEAEVEDNEDNEDNEEDHEFLKEADK